MASEQFQRIRDRGLTPGQVIQEVHIASALGQMTTEEADEILVHYGIKGMRWGIRRPVGTDGLVGGPGAGSGGSSRAKKAAAATGRGTVKVAKATGRGVKKLAGRGKDKSKEKDARTDKQKRESNLTGMTTTQLKSRIDRLELEKRYKNLEAEMRPVDIPTVKDKKTKTKGVRISRLSDAQLKAYVDRVKLEQQYKELTKPAAVKKKEKQKNAVTKFVYEMIGKQARRQATSILNAKLDPIVADMFNLASGSQKKDADEEKKNKD